MLCATLVRGIGLVGEDRYASLGEFLDELGVCGAVEEADENLALAASWPISSSVRRGDLDYEVSLAVDGLGALDDLRPSLLVVLVEVVVAAGAGLDDDLETVLDEPADGLGHQPDPPLPLVTSLRYPYLHAGRL